VVGLAAGRRHGYEPCLAQRVAADQYLVVEHCGAVCDILRAYDVAGDAPRAVDEHRVAGLPRHVQPAADMARRTRPSRRRTWLARGSLRRTAGLRWRSPARPLADILAGGRVVPPEHP